MGEVGGLAKGEGSDEDVYSSVEIDAADLCHSRLPVAWGLPQAVM